MKGITIIALSAVALCMSATFSAAAEPAAEGKIAPGQDLKETRIVRLHATGGISPAEAVIKPGTTVIWVNDSRAQLELQFQGKQVTLACKSPVHFIVDENGSFVSDRIPEDSVASLCFVEKGEFSYVLRNVGGRTYYDAPGRPAVQQFRGKIIVQ